MDDFRRGTGMSEKNLQKALMHLYANVDRYSSYSEGIFEEFALSPSEKDSLKQLMTSQRSGLLLFNEQLHGKRRRLLRDVLPLSAELLGPRLESLLDDYLSFESAEGARNPDDTIRSFAQYAGARLDTGPVSREFELIRFEAVHASVSLPLPATTFKARAPLPLSPDLRLSLAGDTALIACSYDVLAAIRVPSLLPTLDRLPKPFWLFLFQAAPPAAVRTLEVTAGLAGLLSLFWKGLSLADALQTFASATQRSAALGAVERLLLAGVPFHSSSQGSPSASGEFQDHS